MYFVGLDLAWGERSPTGVAVADETGRLRHLGVGRDDSDLVAQLEPYVAGECVVAIDAPLVVSNTSGNRPCEAALNRDFRRFDAGTHPANTGLAWFADGGRGARLCTTLGLDRDPRSTSSRRALEVYPHAASVVLFELSRTLKYKQKRGREFGGLRLQLLHLIRLVEGLQGHAPALCVAGHPGWRELTASVRAATRKAQLRRAEDPVDAVLCAYIARYATERRDGVTIYGDAATGCIVTPTLGNPR